jgi:ribosome-binding factor A
VSVPKSNDRARRVADLIQRELAQIITRESLDARCRLVTITTVKVAPDYSLATIYVVVPDDDEKKSLIKNLNDSAKEFRYILAKQVNMRTTPKLKFIYDESLGYSRKMGQLIKDATSRLSDDDGEPE